MKQYRLKKDLPNMKAGTVLNDVSSIIIQVNSEVHPDWFEPVRWRPEEETTYCFIKDNGEIGGAVWSDRDLDWQRWEQGNCYKECEEAEAAQDKIKELLLSL